MSKKIQISIPTPCHENWENMTPTEKGKFCSSCQKQVIDFSSMNDREIATFFKKSSTGSTCGRFTNDQLNRDIEIPKKRIPWVKYFFQFTLPAFLISMKVSAQKKGAQKREIISAAICSQTVGDVNAIVIYDNITIKGEVIDSASRSPIPNATLHLINSGRNVIADSLGRFEINNESNSNSIPIKITSVGYEPKQIDYSLSGSKNLEEIKIGLIPEVKKLDSVVIVSTTGETKGRYVAGGAVSCIRRSAFQDIKEWVFPPNDAIKIFPNPISRGSNFQIQFNLKNTGEYMMNVFDLNGREILGKQINISSEIQIENFLADNRFSGGTYIVRFTSKQTGKSFSQKIIIQ